MAGVVKAGNQFGEQVQYILTIRLRSVGRRCSLRCTEPATYLILNRSAIAETLLFVQMCRLTAKKGREVERHAATGCAEQSFISNIGRHQSSPQPSDY